MKPVWLRATALAMLLAGGSAAAQNARPDDLGRLFLTPERRAALDRQRTQNIQEVHTIEGATLRLDGVVRRSNGKTTVWINRQALQSNDPANEIRVTVPPGDPTRAVVTPGNEGPASLRVGQAINRTTGETADPVGAGQVVVRKHMKPE